MGELQCRKGTSIGPLKPLKVRHLPGAVGASTIINTVVPYPDF